VTAGHLFGIGVGAETAPTQEVPEGESTISFSLSQPLEATFDLPDATSDGGLVWLAEADAQLGLCPTLAAAVPDWRQGPVRHSLETLIRQRVFQIACGYADQNDATTLRTDPLLQQVCGTDRPLASQPTLSRLENAVDRKSCYRLSQALLEVYLRERERLGRPSHILLDVDGTADPVHGQQAGSGYHGYFRQHMYFPLVVFDGETDQLLAAVLRPGTVHAGRGALAVRKRLVRAIRARWPGVPIALRADSGFALPALYDYCETAGLTYTIGLVPNARLEALAADLLAEAERQRSATDAAKVRLLGETRYQAGAWEQERRVVYKAEALPKGPNTRFVVTNHTNAPQTLYDWYVQRGTSEQWINDFKDACQADRLSDHGFWANQFRLLLHAAAYWLLDTLRRWLLQRGVPRYELGTLQLLLLKVGGWLQRLTDRVRLHLAQSHPGQPLWHLLAARPGRL
jgi:hypothetical protein